MAKLWQKSPTKLHPLVEAYTVGEDPVFDLSLFPFDLRASAAHAKGLCGIGILTRAECAGIARALRTLERAWRRGNIRITAKDEDCHTVIEHALIAELGDVGKKIHTGRSRNDQVLTALRLLMKDRLENARAGTVALARAFLAFAKRHASVPLPGYTHMQQAMLGSVGHYACSFVESLLDDADLLRATVRHIDANPLGSAAGYGVALPLDRDGVTRDLGFRRLQRNSLYCQNSRGKYESLFLESLSQVMLTLGRFANDLLLFTTHEFDFFDVDAALVTGSSIMPQKRNLDGLEILRGNVSVVMGYQQMAKDIARNLPSGYNRDLQLLKRPVIHASEIALRSIDIAGLYLAGIAPKRESIERAITKDIFAADVAIALSKERGIPFRDAYRQAMRRLKDYAVDLPANVASKVSPGGPGNLGWKEYERRLANHARGSRA